MTATEKLRALLDAATARPWETTPCNDGATVNINHHIFDRTVPTHFTAVDTRGRRHGADVALIVAAVNALPALLAVADNADKYLDERDSPSPDYTMRRLYRDRMAAALARLDEVLIDDAPEGESDG